ncbi:hypothetical protein AURDEDRAFT_171758 [Auricularia subglabra TFB-10046 SS5]|nr:hypothetical protein AURDEDRAFT_171758 [Auricularia subglabra TFB-10046 SS5]
MLRASDSTPANVRDVKTPAQKLKRFRWDLARLDCMVGYRCLHAEIVLLQAADRMHRGKYFHRARFPVPPPREPSALEDPGAAVKARLANMRPSPLRNELDEAALGLERGKTSSARTPATAAPTPPAVMGPLPRPASPPPATAASRLPSQPASASGPTTATTCSPSSTPPQPTQTAAPRTPTTSTTPARATNNDAGAPSATGKPAGAASQETHMVHETPLLRTVLWASLGASVAAPAEGALAFAGAARKGRTVTDGFRLRPSHAPLSLCTSTILVKTRAPKSAKPASAAGREPLKPHNALKRGRDDDDNAEEPRAAKRAATNKPRRAILALNNRPAESTSSIPVGRHVQSPNNVEPTRPSHAPSRDKSTEMPPASNDDRMECDPPLSNGGEARAN